MRGRVLFTTIFVLFFVLVGLFAWRVFYFYQKIQDGTLTSGDISFSERLTTDRFSEAVAALPPSDVNVDTDDDPSVGAKDAVLTIVEFADFGCPYSREASYTIRRLSEVYGSKIRYVYRDFPLTDIHPEAQLAAEAGECADEQGNFWALHDKMYQNQHDLSRGALISYATQVGLDTGAFTRCLASGKYKNEVLEDYEAGLEAGVYGTPTFFFNGQRIEGSIPEDVFEALINAYLSREDL